MVEFSVRLAVVVGVRGSDGLLWVLVLSMGYGEH